MRCEVTLCQSPRGDLIGEAAILQRLHHVIYVDCLNSFDPHRLYRLAGDESCLERIHICRPFTLYQLREAVKYKLEAAIQETKSEAVLVSDPTVFEVDGEVGGEEYHHIMGDILGRLEALTRDYMLVTLLGVRCLG